jgi:alpha-D-xyloside xylohydrolase
LFIEYPEDPGAWQIENEYLFGSDILVAPMFENGSERNVYLPGGEWIDFQTGSVYQQGWNRIKTSGIEAVILVRDGAVIPQIALAQSTLDMDWSKMDLEVFASGQGEASGIICLPSDNELYRIKVNKTARGFELEENPLLHKTNVKVKVKPLK